MNGKFIAQYFEGLATEDFLQRRYAAGNSNTPTYLLQTLSTDDDETVRTLVEKQRHPRLLHYIKTLTDEQRTYAELLLPTFTGWPDDLQQVIDNILT